MIVQTIEISLSKGRAPDLLAHVAETGREIEMIPDVEISADDYTAEIDTVKPDGTFTMTNCSIDENGHIIAPIAEQAVAVKGLCHYIIKIYNDDVVVYSACGSLWVDDHLITDDMIESVAEVNGYRFPQDFATMDDLPILTDIIDDSVVVNDKTWSSNKISDALLKRYSLDEKLVGFWVDNRPIFEKTINFGTLPNSTSKNVAHNISNLDYVIKISCTAYNPLSGYTLPIPNTSRIDVATQAQLDVNTSNINIITAINLSVYSECYVTLLYLKSN